MSTSSVNLEWTRTVKSSSGWDVAAPHRLDASAQATSAGSGCVACSSSAPVCPKCASDEYCVLSVLSCTACPETYCAKKKNSGSSSDSSATASAVSSSESGTSSSSSNKSSAKVGGIVGGVVGGVAVIVVIVLLILYFKYWRKNRTRNRDVAAAHGDVAGGFVDEKDVETRNGREEGEMQAGTRNSWNLNQARNRSSAATQMTKASNILPIAYIPGVTAGSRSQHKLPALPRHLLRNGDTRSHITLGSSILGGVDDDQEITGDVEQPGLYSEKGGEPNASQDALTTAIRARPKLVQITEEDDADDEDGDDEDVAAQDHINEAPGGTSDSKHSEVTSVVLCSSGETTREDGRLSEADSDDDGSFILDVGVESAAPLDNRARESETPQETREGSGSPFEDRFQI